jgi:hypothetical protein
LRAGHKERAPVPRRRGRAGVPVGLVVETRYFPDAQWAPVPLSAGERVLVLLANTVPARDRPAEVLAVLARATGSARGFRTNRRSAARAARALLALANDGADKVAPPAAERQEGRILGFRRG